MKFVNSKARKRTNFLERPPIWTHGWQECWCPSYDIGPISFYPFYTSAFLCQILKSVYSYLFLKNTILCQQSISTFPCEFKNWKLFHSNILKRSLRSRKIHQLYLLHKLSILKTYKLNIFIIIKIPVSNSKYESDLRKKLLLISL